MSATYSDNHQFTVRPSQWTNLIWIILGVFDVAVLQFGVIALLALLKMLQTHCTQYQFNERTLVHREGILNVDRREMHYFRIKSLSVSEPLWMRLFGLADVSIRSSDPYMPSLTLHAVPKSLMPWRTLREKTHLARRDEGVREVDFSNLM
jgi:membrane protein YdbS with pleckstrin-like domain